MPGELSLLQALDHDNRLKRGSLTQRLPFPTHVIDVRIVPQNMVIRLAYELSNRRSARLQRLGL